MGHKAAIYAMDHGEQPPEFYSVAGEGWLVKWDLNNSTDGVLVAQAKSNLFSIKKLKSNRVLSGNMNGGLHLIDLESKDNNRDIAHHSKGIYAIKEIADYFLTAGGDGLLTKWNASSFRAMESLQLSEASLRSIAIHPSKALAAIGASDQNIYFIDLKSFELLNVIEKAHDNSVFSLHFSRLGNQLISGGRDAHLKVWEIPDKIEKEWKPEAVKDIAAHLFTINKITFHPTLNFFATSSRDKSIKIWNGQTYELLKVIDFEKYKGHVNSVNDLLWSTYNNYLISCSDDRRIIIWKIDFEEK